MVDFDDLNDVAVGIAFAATFVLYLFMFELNAGMDSIPVAWRIITIVLGLPVFYFVADKKLD